MNCRKVLNQNLNQMEVDGILIANSENEKYRPMPEKRSPIGDVVLKKFGSAVDFVKRFNPDCQIKFALNKNIAYTSPYPSLAAIREAYTVDQVNLWIIAQLENLNRFCGVKEKMDMQQMVETAFLIQSKCYYFKVSELMLFFHELKSGTFKGFYGVIDPIVITSAINEFKLIRAKEIEQYERVKKELERKKEMERWEKEAVPCPPHLINIKKIIHET